MDEIKVRFVPAGESGTRLFHSMTRDARYVFKCLRDQVDMLGLCTADPWDLQGIAFRDFTICEIERALDEIEEAGYIKRRDRDGAMRIQINPNPNDMHNKGGK